MCEQMECYLISQMISITMSAFPVFRALGLSYLKLLITPKQNYVCGKTQFCCQGCFVPGAAKVRTLWINQPWILYVALLTPALPSTALAFPRLIFPSLCIHNLLWWRLNQLCVLFDHSQWPVFSWMGWTYIVDPPTQMTAQGKRHPAVWKLDNGKFVHFVHTWTPYYWTGRKRRDITLAPWFNAGPDFKKEISWSFWLQILFSPSGLPFLHWSSEASKPTTRFWEYLQYRRNCPWGDLTWLMFSECRLSSSAHNRAVLKIRNHDTGFVKLLRSFVFISLITSSTILHVTIVTPRRY